MELIKVPKRIIVVVLVLIGIIIYLSLKNTLNFYFYTDDYAVLYHLQNNIPYIHPFYDFVPKLYSPLYQVFGLNSFPYFFFSLFSHFLASFAIYLLLNKVTQNKLISLFSSLIFATGYIGIDSFTQMNTGPVDNLNIIFTALMLLFTISFLESRRCLFYFLSLIIFSLSVYLFPFRSFVMILLLLTTDFLFGFKKLGFDYLPKHIGKVVVRNLPFLAAYYIRGLATYGVGAFHSFTNNLSLETARLFFAIPGNMLIPSSLNLNIDAWKSGIIFSISIMLIYLFSKKKFPVLSRALLLSFVFLIEGFIGFFILLPVFDSNAEVNRYLSVSFFAYSTVITLSWFLVIKLIFRSKNNILLFFLPVFLVIGFIFMSLNYQGHLVKERSNYAKQFFNELKGELPTINKNGKKIFYFDTANYFPVPQRFGPILLGAYMPSEATLAVHYKLPIEKLSIIKNFDEISKSQSMNFYTFYYDEKGLVNTTDNIKSLLSNPKDYQIPVSNLISDFPYSSLNSFITDSVFKNLEDKGSLFKSPKILILADSIPSMVPSVFKFDLKVTPIFPQTLPVYDFSSVDSENLDNVKKIKSDFGGIDRSLYFDYLSARRNYYATVAVSVSSSHPEHPKELIVDNDPNTSWFTEEGPWQVGRIPWVKIDLGVVKSINRIVWTNVSLVRTPRDYEILTSIDGINWRSAKKVINGSQKNNGETVSDYFPSRNARLVMFTIYKTTDQWAPGFSEIEVIEDKFSKIDVSLAKRLEKAPFQYLSSQEELDSALSYIRNNSEIKILIKTNADKEFNQDKLKILPILPDSQFHSYTLQLPVGGLYFKELMISPLSFPAELEINNLRIKTGE